VGTLNADYMTCQDIDLQIYRARALFLAAFVLVV
jgi:hypothetical protein